MKIVVAHRDLESALRAPVHAVAKKGGLESHFVLRHQDGKVYILAQNQQVLASSPLVCQVEGDEGAFTVEGWRLQKWLQAVEDTSTLTLVSEASLVKATSPGGTVRWAGLDPSTFPYWDKSLAKASKKATIKAARLHAALSHVKDFIYTQEAVAPHLAVTEVQEGVLKATDLVAMVMVSSDALKGSKLRVHYQQVGVVLSYLAGLGDGSVDLLEFGNTLYFQGDDGSVFGVAIPIEEFPEVKMDSSETPAASFLFRIEDIQRALALLSTASAKDNTKVRFLWDSDHERINLAVDSEAGDQDTIPLVAIEADKPEGFPPDGFGFSIPHLERIMGKSPGETLRFDLIKKKNRRGEDSGLVRFQWEANQDSYLTAVQWL